MCVCLCLCLCVMDTKGCVCVCVFIFVRKGICIEDRNREITAADVHYNICNV